MIDSLVLIAEINKYFPQRGNENLIQINQEEFDTYEMITRMRFKIVLNLDTVSN